MIDKHFLLLVSDESSHHLSIHIFGFSSIVSPPSPNFNVAWFLNSSGRGHFPDKSSHHQTHVFHNIEMGGQGGTILAAAFSCVSIHVFFRVPSWVVRTFVRHLSDSQMFVMCRSSSKRFSLVAYLVFQLGGGGGGDTCVIYDRLGEAQTPTEQTPTKFWIHLGARPLVQRTC